MKLVIPKKSLLSPLFLGVILVVVLVVTVMTIITTNNNRAQAVTAAGFKPGRIIDDAIFTNKNSMNVSQIQVFLNSKVPVCDTAGSQLSEYGGPDLNGDGKVQRWEWGQANYNQTTFPCLRDYVDKGKTSAQLIYDTSQEFNINPQVILVLLQKEQALVNDTWPLAVQYRSATGYGCPDTAACDSAYYGLTNQVRWAATMFRAILNNSPTWYTPYVLGTNYIQYNPNASCGGSNVVIENRATQALYNYTPYQPSQAALDAGWGQVNCGAYGNRNFYLYFNDWFGNSILSNLPGCQEATNTTIACIWQLYSPGSAQFLTASNQLRDNLFVQNSYQYIGRSFFGNVVSLPGNIPIYRLTKPSGASFLTPSSVEYNSLVSAGYTGNGIDFYAAPAGSNSGYPVYRLYKASTGVHIWTGDFQEYQQLVGFGYTYEGEAFASITPINQETPPPAGKTLVYRFYIPQSFSHFWTQDLYERDRMIRAGYKYEGVASNGSTNTADKPVYRLYSSGLTKHLYTTDLNEKNVLSNNGIWVYEGISQYVSLTNTDKPVYRLYAESIKTHLLTTDQNERNVLLNNGIWRDEGVAWYQP